MENSREIDFECALKFHNLRKQAIYDERPKSPIEQCYERHYTSRDVLSNVSKQLSDLHRADTFTNKTCSKLKTGNCKKAVLEPVKLVYTDCNNLPQQCQSKNNKFETQCVTDTQLINIVQNVENLVEMKGVTQEFDCSFHHTQNEDTHLENKTNGNNEQVNFEFGTDLDNKQVEINFASNACLDVTENENVESSSNIVNEADVIDDILTTSPIISYQKTPSFTNSRPPFTCTLDDFENFEAIAFPALEKNSDLALIKQVIDSEIINKELCLGYHTKPTFNYENRSPSPEITTKSIRHLSSSPCKSVIDIQNKQPVEEFIKEEVLADIEMSKYFCDEILFSSDEENSEETNFRESPFTCVLERSPSDKDNILDETMYVGFQTASNKSIQIRTESFSKANSILEDKDESNCNLTLIVDINSDANKAGEFCTDGRKDKNLELNVLKNVTRESITTKGEVNLSNRPEAIVKRKSTVIPDDMKENGVVKISIGCNDIASKKKEELSKEDLAKCRQVFQDVDFDEEFVEKDPEKKVLSAANIGISQTCNKNTNKNKLDAPTEHSNKKNLLEFTEQIELDDQIFLQEFENDLMSQGIDKIKDVTESNSVNNAKIDDNIEINKKLDKYEKYDELLIKKVECGNFVGFKTASNKHISISEKALAKTKNIFEDCDVANDLKFVDNYHNIINNCIGNPDKTSNIKTPFTDLGKENPKNMNIVDYKTTMTTPNLSECDLKEIVPIIPPGFKTASDKPIAVSSEGLVKTKKMLEEIDSEISNVKKVTKNYLEGFENSSKNPVNISKEALVKSKNIFSNFNDAEVAENYLKDDSKGLQDHCHLRSNTLLEISNTGSKNDYNIGQSFEFKGFQTASKKQIKISKDAVFKTKKLFQDIENVDQFFTNSNGFDREIPLSDKINRDNEALDFPNTDIQSGTINLQTRSDDGDLNKHNLEGIDLNSAFEGFKTASNKQVRISNTALTKSKALFEDFDLNVNDHGIKLKTAKQQNAIDDGTLQSHLDKQSLVGFRTASNKHVKISEQALCKSKKLFQNLELGLPLGTNIIDKNCFGDELDNNRFCNLRENSKKSDEDMPKVGFQGFQTASNKPVKISEQALSKSKRLFQDLDVDNLSQTNKTGKKGFQGKSANNINCDVSEDSMKNSIDVPNIGFQGFQTASNKRVKISEQALSRSKKLFQDLDVDNLSQTNKTDKKGFQDKSVNNRNCDVGEDRMENSIGVPNIGFQGFHTASNKKVNISEHALAKSKKLFQDLEVDNLSQTNKTDKKGFQDKSANNRNYDIGENSKKNSINEPNKGFQGFNTASNKKVKISEHALANSKKLFQDLDFSEDKQYKANGRNNDIVFNNNCNENEFMFTTANNKNVTVSKEAMIQSKHKILGFNENKEIGNSYKENMDVENAIDTQVLNNFEETLYTEDFCKDVVTNKSKRSGSPLLPCPRAKKRKGFETPYGNLPVKKIDVLESADNASISITCDKDYKQNKKYTLRDLRNMSKLNDNVDKVDPYIFEFNFDNILDFQFTSKRNEYSEISWSTENIKKHFLCIVNKTIVPDGWVDNHMKLIIYKLIKYEINFKNTMYGVCSVKNVLEQLKYRYNKELYNMERPAFRKILEKDDVSTRTLILHVLAIYIDGRIVSSVTNADNVELLLTDGWYCIRACLDQMLKKLVCNQIIKVGTKIATHGAELLNCEQGIEPWEDTSSVRLKLFGNSTRPARWDARLGYCGAPAILTHLSSVRLEGGKVSKLRAFVTRVYPTLYVEKFDDGSTVTRSERLEHQHQMKHESERQALLERIYEEVEKEFIDQESQELKCDSQVRNLESGSQINWLMKQSKDSGEYRANLTNTQCNMLQDYLIKKREKMLESVQSRVKEKLKSMGLQNTRNVVQLLKIRIADVDGSGDVSKAMMSIWRPSELVMDIIKEGTWIDIYNAAPTAVRYSEIQLSAGRQTVFRQSKYKESDDMKRITDKLRRNCYSIGDLVKNASSTTDYNEVDTVGLVFSIEPSMEQFESTERQLFQNIYLIDAEMNMMCINFWGGLKICGYENIFDIGQTIACMNLMKRAGNSRKSIPQFRATEFSYFTKTPKLETVRIKIDDLNSRLSSVDIKKLIIKCKEIRNNSLFKSNTENISPYRINNSSFISKHRTFIESPLAQKPKKVDDILNLSGLDFESTFKQFDTQDMSVASLRKRKVNEKIAKLSMYGEPPPLNSIHIINKSKNASSAYKSPLTVHNDIINNVASEKVERKPDYTINCDCSPVINVNNGVKRTNANPVKLNFSNDNNQNSDVNSLDPFAEEFDASPPLSLD
ncbi:breast cancer type 2 susceptibility protein [Battus philenor]|uniref:breast cancer type 2 susceptibility protein n=1 Tax=Battus philenor TaxID=42288 RepID=UPI0035CEE415